MNAKLTKKLRKLALSMAQAPAEYTTDKNSKKFVLVADTTPTVGDEGAENVLAKPPLVLYHEGTVRVNTESARGVYKMLKRAVRISKRKGHKISL